MLMSSQSPVAYFADWLSKTKRYLEDDEKNDKALC